VITESELQFVHEKAYIPEHLPEYVTSIVDAEPFLFKDFLLYRRKRGIVIVGYPLNYSLNEKNLQQPNLDVQAIGQTINQIVEQYKPTEVSAMAPALPPNFTECPTETDWFYFLDLTSFSPTKKLRNLLKKAERQLTIEVGKDFQREHHRLMQFFIRNHDLNKSSITIFERAHHCLRSETALLFSARNAHGELVAYCIGELGASRCAFYLFSVSTTQSRVPGASDLLLYRFVQEAKQTGKQFINLGLGINPGIAFFKKKWGALPLLKHVQWTFQPTIDEWWQHFLQFDF